MIKLTDDQKGSIKSGNIRLLKEVLTSRRSELLEMLVSSTRGSDHDNQLKGRCQELAEIIELLPRA